MKTLFLEKMPGNIFDVCVIGAGVSGMLFY